MCAIETLQNNIAPRDERKTSSVAVVLDFDGTVTERDIGDAIVKRFGLPGWDSLEDRFRKGEVVIRALWTREISRLPGDRVNDMTEFALETAKVRPGLRELVDYCKERGIYVEVASSGLEFYISGILRSNALADLPVACLTAEFSINGSSRLTMPAELTQCARNGMCKCARIWNLQNVGVRVIFVGDGASDVCAGPAADVLVARSTLAKVAFDKGWAFSAFEDFHDVMRVVQREVAG